MKKVNNIYIYNGSFPHLLNVIKYLYQENIIPLDIKDDTYQPDLFTQTINLNILEDESIIPKIITNLGTRLFNALYYLYLSSYDNKEMLIYNFLLYGIKYQDKVFLMRHNDDINTALNVIKYVGNENHKMKGFLRFKELKNKVLYAEFAPTNNVLPILVKHFKERLKNEVWLINDVKRNICAFYTKKEIYFLDTSTIEIFLNEYSPEENQIESLWQVFYDTVGIKERKNESCRRNFMPKKYWQFITEVKGL